AQKTFMNDEYSHRTSPMISTIGRSEIATNRTHSDTPKELRATHAARGSAPRVARAKHDRSDRGGYTSLRLAGCRRHADYRRISRMARRFVCAYGCDPHALRGVSVCPIPTPRREVAAGSVSKLVRCGRGGEPAMECLGRASAGPYP